MECLIQKVTNLPMSSLNYVKSLYKDVIELVCTAVTVTFLVPSTVITTHVTFSREPVLGVSLDGLGYSATQSVEKAGTVIIVVTSVWDIAEITLLVTT